MSEYIPTTDEVREDYAHMIAPHTTWGEDGFDAWLDRERAAARREGQAEAWDEGLDAGRDRWMDAREFGDPPVNPYRNGADQ